MYTPYLATRNRTASFKRVWIRVKSCDDKLEKELNDPAQPGFVSSLVLLCFGHVSCKRRLRGVESGMDGSEIWLGVWLVGWRPRSMVYLVKSARGVLSWSRKWQVEWLVLKKLVLCTLRIAVCWRGARCDGDGRRTRRVSFVVQRGLRFCRERSLVLVRWQDSESRWALLP